MSGSVRTGPIVRIFAVTPDDGLQPKCVGNSTNSVINVTVGRTPGCDRHAGNPLDCLNRVIQFGKGLLRSQGSHVVV